MRHLRVTVDQLRQDIVAVARDRDEWRHLAEAREHGAGPETEARIIALRTERDDLTAERDQWKRQATRAGEPLPSQARFHTPLEAEIAALRADHRFSSAASDVSLWKKLREKYGALVSLLAPEGSPAAPRHDCPQSAHPGEPILRYEANAWRVRGASVWGLIVTHCPWCGAKLP
jgi:hypothetical protein